MCNQEWCMFVVNFFAASCLTWAIFIGYYLLHRWTAVGIRKYNHFSKTFRNKLRKLRNYNTGNCKRLVGITKKLRELQGN